MSIEQKGKLIDGFVFKEARQYDFVMTPIKTVESMFNAELESGGFHNQLAFSGALIAEQLQSIGSCPGPFTFEQIKGLSPRDFQILRKAQHALDDAAQAEDPNDESPASSSGG
ncbi:MAG: hypothetical protein ACPG4U_16620 [Pseudomonadales bacterium]